MAGAIEEALRSFFKHQKEARLVFLMGSYAKGTARAESDVDVAVLFGAPPGVDRVMDLKGRLEDLLRRDVDIVVLDDAGPVVGMQALKTGIVLYGEGNAYNAFFAKTVSMYDDLKIIRREIEESVLRRRMYA